MEKDGLIKVSGRVIWLMDLAGLENGIIGDFASLFISFSNLV